MVRNGNSGLVDRREKIARREHLSNLLRLRRLARIGLIAWPLFTLGDWFVTEFVHPGRLSVYLGLRAIGFAIIVPAFVRAHSKPTPSPGALKFIDTAASAGLCCLVTLSMAEFRGIASPLVLGVMTIMIARGAILSEKWQRGLGSTALIFLAYPLTLMLMASFSDRIALQFRDPEMLGTFGLNLLFLAAAAALTLAGGHMGWSLRREVLEAKSVGRYKLIRQIGRGGMGEVWHARHTTMKREVAVKVLAPEKKNIDDLAIARFEREVKATCELAHPNTIRVYDYGVTEEGSFFYAMELLRGEDIANIVRREGPMDPRRAAKLIWQASRALSEAHGRGIIHRDLKPENLFVTEVGGEKDFLKVLDFGLVHLQNSDIELTRAGWAVGTPTYIAPEVVLGERADARSDVFSLGTVLYFMLTGQTPFGARDLRLLLAANVREAPKPPSERIGRALPHALENIVLTCLAKNPEARYESGGELASALESFLTASEYQVPRFAIRNRRENSHVVLCGRESGESGDASAAPISTEMWSDVTEIDETPPIFAGRKK